ncbi:MAG: hypothetical protein R2729_01185 [Bryobacteraceae bacterium]
MTPDGRRRLALLLAWLLAMGVLLSVYGEGLDCWFQQDDFAWLGLKDEVRDWPSFLNAMFAPKAQGTFRFLSERAYFLGFRTLFGLDALPYRILVFATQALNLLLVILVGRRITGCLTAGAAAAMFWTVNASLAIPLAWTSAYNQILCPTFLLGAFYFLLRWLDTGEARFYWAQAAIFIVGFGALEHNIVYPAIAAAWLVLSGSYRRLPALVPIGVVSAVYLYIHNLVAPKSADAGPYAIHTDPASLAATLEWYLVNWTGGVRMQGLEQPDWLQTVGAATPVLIGVPLLLFALWRLRQRQWTVLFPIAWFLILLAPVLPLRDHQSDYYLVMPTLGVALLGGWAVSDAVRFRPWAGAAAALLAVAYLATTIPVGQEGVSFYCHNSQRVRNMVLGVEYAHRVHPGKLILLHSVDSDLFWFGVNDKPFRLVGVNEVFLTPGSESNIQRHPDLGDPEDFTLGPAQTIEALRTGLVVVYNASEERLRNITRTYAALARANLRPSLASRVDVGHTVYASQLGPGWYEATDGYRWMGKTAHLVLRIKPGSGPRRLEIEGYCPREQVAGRGVLLSLAIGSEEILVKRIAAEGSFTVTATIPERRAQEGSVYISISVDRVFHEGGPTGRELGLVFGSFQVR